MENQYEIHALRNAWRLSGADWTRRIQAAALLGEAGAVEAVPDLEAVAIENKHSELVKASIRALGQIHDETALAAVGQVLKNITNEIVVSQCLEILLSGVKNGSLAACLALTVLRDRFFSVLLDRAKEGDTVAGQAIVSMGEPVILLLRDAWLISETREIAGKLLDKFGDQTTKLP